MSLAQHVTNLEGLDFEPLRPTESHQTNLQVPQPDLEDNNDLSEGKWRRASLDVFAPPEIPSPEGPPAEAQLAHIAAYKVSTALRVAQVAAGVIACCFASGIVFGFAALKPVLIAEGVYKELCPAEGVQSRFFTTTRKQDDNPLEVPCAEQDLRLNLFFVAASIMTNVSSLFAGSTLDRFGRRACFIISAVATAVGLILLGYAFSIPEFDGYLLGNLFLGLGGTFLFVPSFQLANAFPKQSGIIVALVTGAFDASAAVFLFYRLAYDASGRTFTPDKFFFGYLVVPVAVLVTEWTIMPPRAYHSTPELEQKIEKAQDPTRDVHESDDDISSDGELYRVRSHRAERRYQKLNQLEDLIGDAEEREERLKQEEARQDTSVVWGVLHNTPAHRQMLSPWFLLILLLTVLQMLRMNYFIATIRTQYRFILGSDDLAEDINHFFDAALPIGGLASTPFIGVMLNRVSVKTTLAVLTGFIAVIGALNCLPYTWAAYTTVVGFVLFRPLYYSAMSDYAIKVFGFATFGRIYGMIICLSGLANFGQSGLDALMHGPLGGDPTPINFVMAVVGTIIGIALTLFVHVHGNDIIEKVEEECVEEERVPLIREDDEEYGTLHRT